MLIVVSSFFSRLVNLQNEPTCRAAEHSDLNAGVINTPIQFLLWHV